MSHYLLYNGSFYKNDETIINADNRGLRYGDGLFETLRVENNKIFFLNWHFERLLYGLRLLQFELPEHFTAQHFAEQIISLCKKNKHNYARIRINIIRGKGGLYDPENHFPNCIIQSWALAGAGFQLNENGLITGIYNDAKKITDQFSNIKSNNYLPYTMGALHAKKNKWNDALILNYYGRICDATIANVFLIKNEIIYTCPLTEGCVAGIIRKYLLEKLPENNFLIKEKELTVEDVLAADEVFLTNAIKGIHWVKQCDESIYTNVITTRIFNTLLKNMD